MSKQFQSQKAFVEAMQGMILTRGWRDFFRPELERLRKERIDELIYGSSDPALLLAARDGIAILDNVLSLDERVKEAAQLVAKDVQEAGNVLQSETHDADEVNAVK